MVLDPRLMSLDATPNFAAKLNESNLPWPPASPMKFPLKDW